MRLLVAVGLGAAAFSMQDVLLEPYGGQILGLSVGATTSLTALWALGMLAGFTYAARRLGDGADPHRLAGFGGVVGIAAFLCVIFAGPLQSPALLAIGATLIGVGARAVLGRHADRGDGDLSRRGRRTGLALGAWGAVQATARGPRHRARRVRPRRGVGGGGRHATSARRWPAPPPATPRSTRRDRRCCSARSSRSGRSSARDRRLRPPPTRFGLSEFPDLKGTAMHPNLTPGIDVALLVFWAFVLFFIAPGLLPAPRGSARRLSARGRGDRPARHARRRRCTPRATKSFLLPFGHGIVTAPTKGREPVDIAARRTDRFAGAPYAPTGDPLVDGIGPAAWADRAKRPDLDMDGHPRIVPLSARGDFWVAREDPDLTGWPVVGADGAVAGTVSDLWIDRADRLVRYIQLAATAAPCWRR